MFHVKHRGLLGRLSGELYESGPVDKSVDNLWITLDDTQHLVSNPN